MPYEFATEKIDYSDYASGRVIYSAPGAPAFPVRLACEIFERAQRHLDLHRRLVLFDPTCGGAYHLAALGFLYGSAIETILASDADREILSLAGRNLGLLSTDGLARREAEIAALHQQYGKESHAEALKSASLLRQQLSGFPAIRTRVFQANALNPHDIRGALAGETIDLVISDIPYGQMTGWIQHKGADTANPVRQMLEALLPVLSSKAVVCIAANKAQKAAHDGCRRLERFQVGKRQVTLLQPLG